MTVARRPLNGAPELLCKSAFYHVREKSIRIDHNRRNMLVKGSTGSAQNFLRVIE